MLKKVFFFLVCAVCGNIIFLAIMVGIPYVIESNAKEKFERMQRYGSHEDLCRFLNRQVDYYLEEGSTILLKQWIQKRDKECTAHENPQP